MNRLILALCLLALTVTSFAQEQISLTTPIAAKPAIANYTPGSLTITLVPSASIVAVLIGTDGVAKSFTYPCAPPCAFSTPAQVLTLIGQLNTVNLSTRSLWRRLFDRLVLDFPTEFVGGATVP